MNMMKNSLVFILLGVVSGCDDVTPLTRTAPNECGEPCWPTYGDEYTDPDGIYIAHRGICRPGTVQCDKDFHMTCVGTVLPESETCNGLDDNCNGTVDELADEVCRSDCGPGHRLCIGGSLAECDARLPSQEECNGLDDDCDGEYDELSDVPVDFCYSGPEGTAGVGPCHPGITSCEGGQSLCVSEQVPRTELCDNIDNDCNAQVDDGLGNSELIDIVFAIDGSASMVATIEAVASGVGQWSGQFETNPDIRFAILMIPDNNGIYGSETRLDLNFTDAHTFDVALQANRNAVGSGAEPNVDAVYLASDYTTMFMTSVSPRTEEPLNWRPDATHIMIMFTDEEPQSYLTPAKTIYDARNAATLGGLIVYVFGGSIYQPEWSEITDATGGVFYQLGSSTYIRQSLTDVINNATCSLEAQ